jgi:hypothetical protein
MTTPDRAAYLLRELLQTPREQLTQFPRRMALHTQPTQEELECAQEVLFALVTALESERGPAWQRIRDAWVGLRQHVAAAIPLPGSLDPAPPAWLGGALPAKPTLGDPAPGTHASAEVERERARFVPTAPPAFAVAPAHPISSPAPMSLSTTPPTPPISPLQALLAGTTAPAPGAPVYGESYAVGPLPAAHGYPPVPQRSPPPPPVRPMAASAPVLQPAPEPVAALDLSAWTTSRYAALCAACSIEPARAPETAREYGLADDGERRRLDDHFAELFDREPAEQEQWERLIVQFRERLRPRSG